MAAASPADPAAAAAAPDPADFLAWLVGRWEGDGEMRLCSLAADGSTEVRRTMQFRVTYTFERMGNKRLLRYSEASWRMDGVPMHSEVGFLRPAAAEGHVALNVAQVSGLAEVSEGPVDGTTLSLSGGEASFVRPSSGKEPSVVGIERNYAVDGDTLRYEMNLATTRAPQMLPHLRARLQRVVGTGSD